MYAIASNTREPIFQINDHIGFDDDETTDNGEIIKGDGQGIDGKVWSKEFFEVDSYNPDSIRIFTNSMGGDVKQSLDMFTSIAHSKSKTIGIISGFAYSCAGWIPLACNVVEMTTGSRWMCHMPFMDDSEDETKESSQFLKNVVDIISTTIADKSGRNGKPKKTKEEIIEMMKSKTYLTSSQMLQEGLIDREITPSGKLVKQIIPSSETLYALNFNQVKVFYKESQIALNSFLKDKIPNTMITPKILNRLKLAENSSEDDVLSAIASFENKIKVLNEEAMDKDTKMIAKDSESMDRAKRLKEMESKAENAEKEAAEAKDAYNKMCASMKNMEVENSGLKEKASESEKEKEAAKNAEKQEKAKNLVAQHKMKFHAENAEKLDVVVKTWEKMAVENYENTEAILDAMGVKVSAPRPFAPTTTTPPALGFAAEAKLGDVMKTVAAKNHEKLVEKTKLYTKPSWN